MENLFQPPSKEQRIVLNKISSQAVVFPLFAHFIIIGLIAAFAPGPFGQMVPSGGRHLSLVEEIFQIMLISSGIIVPLIVGCFVVRRSLFKARAKGQLVLRPGVRFVPGYYLLWVGATVGLTLLGGFLDLFLIGILRNIFPSILVIIFPFSVILVPMVAMYLANYIVAYRMLWKGHAVLQLKS